MRNRIQRIRSISPFVFAVVFCPLFHPPPPARADDVAMNLLAPAGEGNAVDLLHSPSATTQPTATPPAAGTGLSVSAEWLDRLLHMHFFSKAATVFDFETAWVRGSRECGPGCGVVDVAVKGVGALGSIAMESTLLLAFAELGPIDALAGGVAATVGIAFGDQLEQLIRSLPGFKEARQGIGSRINEMLK